MTVQVWKSEIDENNELIGEPESLRECASRAEAEAFIASQIEAFDHSGYVPGGERVGWWGRNDRDHSEKFHFWIE
ncbi:hypothetical protein SAMN05216548_1016 [Faunimonas pinastri]|uniref:Uncharacterized protein n=1 Tax=Faunimonas pinastri TaxID=1855383 RepID=A0A1H8Z166_9HYPH|nr:hypothetical protein [Faunimonas pinastri]SEP58259.1 hypothetical protein SAMN05216548_1016 [Faunimonas pinastri]